MQLTIFEIAEQIGGEVVGDGSGKIESVSAIASAGSSNITFVSDKKHAKSIAGSGAGAVIVSEPIKGLDKPQVLVKDVGAGLIEVLKIFAPKLKAAKAGIDSTAVVAKDAKISKEASIGACVVIESGVEVGKGSVISSGCKIGQNSKVGDNCRLDSNVVVQHNCVIGNNVIIQSNTVIGSIGFGYSFIDGAHRLIPHNGGVVIEDFVEIGSCCCIDRAKFGNTIIGAGTKMDNIIQVGHNAVVGKCCLLVAGVLLAGSAKLGNGVVMAGHAGVAEGVTVGDGVIIAAKSAVTTDVKAGKKMFGMPARSHIEMLRAQSSMRRLPEMVKQLKQLSLKVEKLESSKDDKE
ncbi:MAG: UDP-3-O-(3-hydroxymyristoyl)glucosamine N-acyltransferase [Planctomycetes bacterium]|nr:UDP-3-O-(3-hydroxymyristoyl)glucosamine N-acyltransferase [Planctomycetota bacterium]